MTAPRSGCVLIGRRDLAAATMAEIAEAAEKHLEGRRRFGRVEQVDRRRLSREHR